VLVGYNWQRGPAVFSLEGDFGWTNAHGTGVAVIITTTTTQAPNTYDVNWTSRLRGRVGYALDNWLFYIADGLAVADFDFQEGAIRTAFLSAARPYAAHLRGNLIRLGFDLNRSAAACIRIHGNIGR
jgi:opacity protein-like surface antigen